MDLLTEFFRHNTMMNERLLETCRQLTAEQLAATTEGTFGSIGATLVHIANAQTGYAARLHGTERPERLPEDPFPGFDAVSERFRLGNQQLEQAARRGPTDKEVVVGGDDEEAWRLPVSLILIQAVNHGTEHRSQISTILSQIGVEPPEMDGWNYFGHSGLMVRA
ncbi:MAG TPA: DinB family protein [Actinomycetota bacterium]|nr:DinB family protein [Actinomycetota bacterium]